MAIEYLVLLSYGVATLFLMTLIGGIGVVTYLRRKPLERQQIAAASHPEALRQKLYMVQSPLDDVQTWNSQLSHLATTYIRQPTPRPTALPVRYQQTLLYADNMPNPQNEVETKPLVMP